MCALAVEVTLFQIQNYSQFCGQDSQEKVPEEAVIQPIGSFASYVSKSHSKISPDSLKAIHCIDSVKAVNVKCTSNCYVFALVGCL